jgi:hypothetical protein
MVVLFAIPPVVVIQNNPEQTDGKTTTAPSE